MLRPSLGARMYWLMLPALLVLAGVGGCSQARLIRDNPEGGVVSIPNNTNQWPSYYRNRAEYLMRKKCPEGFVIVREQAVEDNPAERDGRKPNEDFEYNGAYQRIRNARREAYHITFRRKAAAPPVDRTAPGIAPPDGPAASPRSPATDHDKEELPPPRQFPPHEAEG